MKQLTQYLTEKFKLNSSNLTPYNDEVGRYIEELSFRFSDKLDKNDVEDYIKSKKEPNLQEILDNLLNNYINPEKDNDMFGDDVVDDTYKLFKILVKYPNKFNTDKIKDRIIKGMTKYVVENY